MTLPQELKQGKFKSTNTFSSTYGLIENYETESGHKVEIVNFIFGYQVSVDDSITSWFYGWRIRRAMRKKK